MVNRGQSTPANIYTDYSQNKVRPISLLFLHLKAKARDLWKPLIIGRPWNWLVQKQHNTHGEGRLWMKVPNGSQFQASEEI